MKIKSILFATDLSDQSTAALDYASNLAASFAATLHIVYVDDLEDLVAKSAAYPYPSFLTSADRSQVKAELQGVTPTVASVTCVHHFVEGVPSARICALAEQEHVDLIVMSSHGRTGLSRLMLGSVAENVLRHALCPVLIVKQSSSALGNSTRDVPTCSHV
jgi:nucleotide-binding universal stress UspA family protein